MPARLVVLAGGGVGQLELAVALPVEGACRGVEGGGRGSAAFAQLRCRACLGTTTAPLVASQPAAAGSDRSVPVWRRARLALPICKPRLPADSGAPVLCASLVHSSTMTGVMYAG